MEKILGLDLGTNSIGWAIRDTSAINNQIIDKGVLTFEKGVGEEKGNEVPLVKARTEARGKRRNYQAEKYRKWILLECLIMEKMCPLTIEELNEWRYYKKGVGRKYPRSEKFIQWLRFDFNGDGKPDFEQLGFNKHESYYLFRVLAASEKEEHKTIFKNNPQILGRVFYQLVQRRGFKGRDENEAKTMLEGSKENGTSGRNEIAPYINKYKTLGAALYHLQKEQNVRIRKRYNLRKDYESELKEICRIQTVAEEIYKKLWKAIIWQRPLRTQKGSVGICTFERSTLKKEGKEITIGKTRCPLSHPLYEEFRTWVFINNLKINPPDGWTKAAYLKEKIYPLFYNASPDFKLSKIIRQLNKDGAVMQANSKEDTKVISCRLLYGFEKLFGPDWRNLSISSDKLRKHYKKDGSLTEHKVSYTIEDIWHALFTFDDDEKLKNFAKEKLALNEAAAIEFSKLPIQQGYATLSLSAIKKILPYLQKGYLYSHAIYLANLPKVFGAEEADQALIDSFADAYEQIKEDIDKEKRLNTAINELIRGELNSEFRYQIEDNRELDHQEQNLVEKQLIDVYGSKTWNSKTDTERVHAKQYVGEHFKNFLLKPVHGKKDGLFLPAPNLHNRIKDYLRETYGIHETNLKHLWHPSEQETYPAAKEKQLDDGRVIKVLDDPQPISQGFKNPMALKTLHQLKKLLNYLLETGKIDDNTRVVVEIARELNDANKRKAIERWQKDRENENNSYKKIIDEINKESGTDYNREDKALLNKIRLWKEQNMICLYTGKTINKCDLFNGVKYDLEHTIPASMSFDNELKNLTIADTHYNREIKKKRIPFECPNYSTEETIAGIAYKPIIRNLEMIFGKRTIIHKKIKGKEVEIENWEKIEHLEKQLNDWKNKTSDTKEIKDAIIQRRHLIRMELDYCRKKLETFTCKEYKTGWRNSQLRDTQLITKYTLPYLKTVFNKVEVQKASIVNDFREIYNIRPKAEKKDRTVHAHHAMDAAVLTLIPPATTRDKILQTYNSERDNKSGNIHHEKPSGWKDFSASHILSIADDVLINFQPQHRTLTQTYKNVRKRGKQQYVKYKDENGKWHFKLDEKGKKIPLIAKGDTIRGQLHDDTCFAAIKKPVYVEKNGKFIPQTDGRGHFILEKNPKRSDDLFFVSRHLQGLSYFKKLEDLDLIVDPNLQQYIKGEVRKRIAQGKSFVEAMAEPIWAFGKTKDKRGNPIRPIRHLRTQIKAGGGGVINNPAIIRRDSLESPKIYKKNIYALNGETIVCGLYQNEIDGKLIRDMQQYSILDMAQVATSKSLAEALVQSIELKIGKTLHLIPLYAVLHKGQKVLFYRERIDELKQLSSTELSNRLYLIIKFEDGKLSFKHHLNAMQEDELKATMKHLNLPDTGASSFSFDFPIPKLRLSRNSFNFAIEGKHFEVKPGGEIKWIK